MKHRSRKVVMSEDGKGDSPSAKPLLNALSDIADASWDMFVMPGEYANSMYDRPLEPLVATTNSSGEASLEANRTFRWAGDSEADEALRLPTGVKAAERLMPAPVQRPRGLWFEVEGRDIKGDFEWLSQEWTKVWAVVVIIAIAVNGWSGLRELARSQEVGGEAAPVRLNERERQEKFFEELRSRSGSDSELNG